MQNSRDSSVWRTLAVALGDGLAFGVGVTLTRGAARLATANRSATAVNARPALSEAPANRWSGEVRQRGAFVPQAASAAPVSQAAPQPARSAVNSIAMETALAGINRRMVETGSQIDRRLVQLESRIQNELDALDDQDHALAEGVETRIEALRGEIAEAVAAQRQTIDSEMRTLRTQMTSLHKEFAETLGRFMDEQIAKTVDSKVKSMEQELVGAMRDEMQAHAKQVSELRELMEGQDRSMRGMVQSLGETFLQVAAMNAPPAEEAPDAAQANEEAEVPGFARTRQRKPLWRVPIVSSFVVVTGSLMLMHYL